MTDTTDAATNDDAAARRSGATRIVERYVLLSSAVGLITVPVLDVAALGAVHVALIKEITEHYGREFSEHAARNVVIAIGASLIPGSFGSIVGRRILGMLPLVTPGVGLVAMSGLSALVSFMLGTAFVRHFEAGGTLDSFDAASLHRLIGWRS